MKFLLTWLWLVGSAALAQTDYIYTISNNRPASDRMTYAYRVDSQDFRPIPGSPYPLRLRDEDVHITLQTCIAVSDPGPYLYVIRAEPSEIYMYRRLANGQLEELENSPLVVDTPSDDRLTNAVLHPSLPILYATNWKAHAVHTFHIRENGFVEEDSNSPYNIERRIKPFLMDIHPDGRRGFFTATGDDSGIYSFPIDENGMITEINFEVPYVHTTDVAISSDGRYLFLTDASNHLIQRFSIGETTELTNLGEPFDAGFDVACLAIKDNFGAIGAVLTRPFGILIIGDDGQLSWAPGSPMENISFNFFNAAFSEHSNRVLFSGVRFILAFDLQPDGRLIEHPLSFHVGNAHDYLGIAVAPELIGEVHSLDFLKIPEVGDSVIQVIGDPWTPFALETNGTCLDNFQTDENGFFEYAYTVPKSAQVQIKAYCLDSTPLQTTTTIPTLTASGLMLLCGLLIGAALFLSRRHPS